MVNSLPRLESLDEFSCTDKVDPHYIIVCLIICGDNIPKLFGHVFDYLILTIFHIDNDRFILIFLLFLILLLLDFVASFCHLCALFLILQLLNSAHDTFNFLRFSLLSILTLIALKPVKLLRRIYSVYALNILHLLWFMLKMFGRYVLCSLEFSNFGNMDKVERV